LSSTKIKEARPEASSSAHSLLKPFGNYRFLPTLDCLPSKTRNYPYLQGDQVSTQEMGKMSLFVQPWTRFRFLVGPNGSRSGPRGPSPSLPNMMGWARRCAERAPASRPATSPPATIERRRWHRGSARRGATGRRRGCVPTTTSTGRSPTSAAGTPAAPPRGPRAAPPPSGRSARARRGPRAWRTRRAAG